MKDVGRKFGWSLVTLWFVLSFNFFLFRIMPGDPIALLARSQRLSPAALIEQRRILGLDQALPLQYLTYLRQTLSGNLGVSMISGTPVTSIIGSRIWPTVLLVGIGTALAIALGILGGIAGGWNRGSALDRSSLYGSMVLYSTPEGWLGMLVLIVLAGTLGWFPAGGYSSGAASGMAHVTDVAKHLVLPVITLTLSYVGQFLIVMRSSLVDIKEEDFIGIARAKGLTDAMAPPPRGAKRSPTEFYVDCAEFWLRSWWRNRDRDGLLLARARVVDVSGHPESGLPGTAGDLLTF